MTYSRAHLVDVVNGGAYHCISRCVRRGWLCGVDPHSGRDFGHRRAWIERRILMLAGLFAIDLFGYAVMSNHYHLVVRIAPRRVDAWPDKDVARRWLTVTRDGSEPSEEQVTALLALPGRIATLRQRLGSLSWLMRFINEPIARIANREDGVTGRFWEGRFRSVALLDEAAVLACMAYVDLNPERAGLAGRAREASHTSVAHRIAHDEETTVLVALSTLGFTLPSYLQLLEWTRSGEESARRPPHASAVAALSNLGLNAGQWHRRVEVHRFRFRAYGTVARLTAYASALGQHWLCGATPGMAAP